VALRTPSLAIWGGARAALHLAEVV
jgi:hypothetical protein